MPSARPATTDATGVNVGEGDGARGVEPQDEAGPERERREGRARRVARGSGVDAKTPALTKTTADTKRARFLISPR